MAWFLNMYQCERCKEIWTDEWSCMCDDECPECGARDMSPFRSEHLTDLVIQDGAQFVAFRSPETAEDNPDYRELGRFDTRAAAERFLAETE